MEIFEAMCRISQKFGWHLDVKSNLLWAIVNLVDEVPALFQEILIENRLIEVILEDVEKLATYDNSYIKRLYTLHHAINEHAAAELIEDSHEFLALVHGMIWEMKEA